MPETDTLRDVDYATQDEQARIGYVLKMYPRFSETFVVSEILAREADGARIHIFSLRPPIDPRFHDSLARVQAPVEYTPRCRKPEDLWARLAAVRAELGISPEALGELLDADVEDAAQALDVAIAARRHRLTHLHAHFASMATTVARLASLLSGVPYSFTAHAKDLFHSCVDHEDLRRKIAGAHHVVTISEYNMRFLERIGADLTRVRLVYNGLDLRQFAFRPVRIARAEGGKSGPDGELRIAAVGRLVEKKGFDVLVDAVALLRRGGVPVRCDLVGGGEKWHVLAEQVRELALADVVTMHGPLPQGEVREVVAGAHAIAAPCVVGSDGNADGLPTVVLEAMALGTPVVATDVTGMTEAVRHGRTGVIVGQRDAEGLARALLGIWRDREHAHRLARAARELVEESFDSDRQAMALNALLQPEQADVTAGSAR